MRLQRIQDTFYPMSPWFTMECLSLTSVSLPSKYILTTAFSDCDSLTWPGNFRYADSMKEWLVLHTYRALMYVERIFCVESVMVPFSSQHSGVWTTFVGSHQSLLSPFVTKSLISNWQASDFDDMSSSFWFVTGYVHLVLFGHFYSFWNFRSSCVLLLCFVILDVFVN
jgi:hypothetical protein